MSTCKISYNGNEISAVNETAPVSVAYNSATIAGLGSVTCDTQYTIPAGYTTGGTVSLTNDIETALAAI